MRRENVVDIGQKKARASKTVDPAARKTTGQTRSTYCKGVYIAVVDIRPLTRRSLTNLLSNLVPEWRIASFADPHEINKCIRSYRTSIPNLVILVTRSIKGDLHSIKRNIVAVKKLLPGVQVVLLSDSDDAESVATGLSIGASGFITTLLDPEIIIRALVLVVVGGTYIPPAAIAGFLQQHQRQSEDHCSDLISHVHGATVEPGVTFTPRQWDVLRLLRQGLPNKTIAYTLQMQECSVKAHVRQLMQKLGASNRTQVACRAAEFLGR